MPSLPVKLIVFSVLVVAGAYALAKYHVPIFLALKDYFPWLMKYHKSRSPASSETSEEKIRVFTKDELAAHSFDSETIYLAILGRVFDVTKGQRHYGKDGGYNFFSGIDGTRAYITGEFTKEGLVEDIADFSPFQCSELKHWTGFYHENYKYLGRLHGHFYDENGHPTSHLDKFTKCAEIGDQDKNADDLDRIKFPPCNSRWSKVDGGYISCAPGSGGVERDWGGVPRQYFRPRNDGRKVDPRCACVRVKGPNGDGVDTGDRGDLDSPLFKVYDGCDPLAIECKIS